jgi:hypothetical protein
MLEHLNGLHDWSALLDAIDPGNRASALALVQHLAAHGMVGELAPRRQFFVQLVGSGQLARHVANALLADPRVHLLLAPPLAESGAGRAPKSLLGTLCKTHKLAPGDRVLTGVHWGAITADDADMVVVCPSTAEVDQAVVAHLLRARIPHLVLSAHRDRARIGPLVDGYGGACTACSNHQLGGVDPSWLPTLVKMSGCVAHADESLLQWAAAETGLRVGWFIDGVNTLRSTVLEASTSRPGLVSHLITRNPDCSCSPHTASAPKLTIVRSAPAWQPDLEVDALPLAA